MKPVQHTPDSTSEYTIGVYGRLDEEFISAFCPPGTRLEQEGECARLSGIHADQAAILGLLRQLHNLGCAIHWMQARPVDQEE